MPDISSPLSTIFPLLFCSLYFSLSVLYLNAWKSLVLNRLKNIGGIIGNEIMLATKAQYIYDSYLLKYFFMTGTS